ncbi:MAG: GNAT family N-acetyltransferase [Clostridia bacterium]|nr:GNAT family N-acetyltransferase [Clostridia bacterium]
MEKRCFWVNLNDPVYVAYHDTEWGVPLHDDRKIYELFILEIFQAGLSWATILHKRETFRKAYDGFDIDKVITYGEEKVRALMEDKGIIRNRRKILASIRNSAVFRQIQEEFGSFDSYIWGFTGGKIIYESSPLVTVSPLSDRVSKDLKKRGMSFVGSTTIYSFLQAMGIINAHEMTCFCYRREREKEMMQFEKATADDLEDICSIIKDAAGYLKLQGVDQWQSDYPSKEKISEDIRSSHGYVLRDGGEVVGYSALIRGEDPAYPGIEGGWITDSHDYLTVHRVALSSHYRGRGYGNILFSYYKGHALSEGLTSIRIDTHKDNLIMQKLILHNGFRYCGIVTVSDGTKRNAYELSFK